MNMTQSQNASSSSQHFLESSVQQGLSSKSSLTHNHSGWTPLETVPSSDPEEEETLWYQPGLSSHNLQDNMLAEAARESKGSRSKGVSTPGPLPSSNSRSKSTPKKSTARKRTSARLPASASATLRLAKAVASTSSTAFSAPSNPLAEQSLVLNQDIGGSHVAEPARSPARANSLALTSASSLHAQGQAQQARKIDEYFPRRTQAHNQATSAQESSQHGSLADAYEAASRRNAVVADEPANGQDGSARVPPLSQRSSRSSKSIVSKRVGPLSSTSQSSPIPGSSLTVARRSALYHDDHRSPSSSRPASAQRAPRSSLSQQTSLAAAYASASHHNAKGVEELNPEGDVSKSGIDEVVVDDEEGMQDISPHHMGPLHGRRQGNAGLGKRVRGAAESMHHPIAQEEEESSSEIEELTNPPPSSAFRKRPPPSAYLTAFRETSTAKRLKRALDGPTDSTPGSQKRRKTVVDIQNEAYEEERKRLHARGLEPPPIRQLPPSRPESTADKDVMIVRSSSSPDPLLLPPDSAASQITPLKPLTSMAVSRGPAPANPTVPRVPSPPNVVVAPVPTRAALIATHVIEKSTSVSSGDVDIFSVDVPPSSRSSIIPADTRGNSHSRSASLTPSPGTHVVEGEHAPTIFDPYCPVAIPLITTYSLSEHEDRAAARTRTNKSILLAWSHSLDASSAMHRPSGYASVRSHTGLDDWKEILEVTYGPGPIDRGWRKPKEAEKYALAQDANLFETTPLPTSASPTPTSRSPPTTHISETPQPDDIGVDSVTEEQATDWSAKLNRLVKGKATISPDMAEYDVLLAVVESVRHGFTQEVLEESGLAMTVDLLRKTPKRELQGDPRKLRGRAKGLVELWTSKFVGLIA